MHKHIPQQDFPNATRKGVASTARRIALTRLIPLWPAEIDDQTIAGRERIVRLLARALRQERCRGRRGHWAYDLVRHAALARHYRLEAELLEKELRCARSPRTSGTP